MSANQMLNFRARPELASLIESAAAHVGEDRSTFIRIACEERAVKISSGPTIRLGSDTAAKAAPEKDTSESKQALAERRAACPHPLEARRMTATGVKVCQLCTATFR